MTAIAPHWADLSRHRRGAGVAVVAAVVALLAGCATVQPYERGRLAQPDMTEEWTAKARAGQDHATAYREGASGAAGSTGAGCGCN